MARQFSFTVDHMVGRREIELEVTYSVTPGRPARLYGDYPHPEEPAEVEILSVTHDGHSFSLTDEDEEALLQEAMGRSAQDVAEEIYAAAEYRAECRRDERLVAQWERGQ